MDKVKCWHVHVLCAAGLGCLAVPLVYGVQRQSKWFGQWTLLALATFLAIAVPLVAYWTLPRPKPRRKDLWLYVFVAFSFASVVDLLLALETSGIVKSIASIWTRRLSEAYVTTSWGAASCFYNGLVHYSLCLGLVGLYYNDADYRSAGLFWAGSMINNGLVLFAGTFASHLTVRPAILLYLPSLLLPLVFLSQQLKTPAVGRLANRFNLVERLVFGVGFAFCLGLTAVRALAISDNSFRFVLEYKRVVEPALLQPTNYFLTTQSLINVFYAGPFFACLACQLLVNGRLVEPTYDWLVVMAGAIANGQATTILPYFVPAKGEKPVLAGSPPLFWVFQTSFLMIVQLFIAYNYLKRRLASKTKNY